MRKKWGKRKTPNPRFLNAGRGPFPARFFRLHETLLVLTRNIMKDISEPKISSKPRIISENGPQFNAPDFKEFIRLTGTTRARTHPRFPQSNDRQYETDRAQSD